MGQDGNDDDDDNAADDVDLYTSVDDVGGTTVEEDDLEDTPKKPPSESRDKTSKVWFHDQVHMKNIKSCGKGNTVVLMESRLVWVENDDDEDEDEEFGEQFEDFEEEEEEGDMDDEEDHCLVYRSLLELFKEDFAPIHILGQFNHRFIIAHRVALNKVERNLGANHLFHHVTSTQN
ncbi:hypothetical protein JB92DRAFT_3128753 [Gautieria morchelliformis]|nr:hypothetical protein JB92DRAFT_3128753 [Gautieria morchelliformis]